MWDPICVINAQQKGSYVAREIYQNGYTHGHCLEYIIILFAVHRIDTAHVIYCELVKIHLTFLVV